MKTLIRRAACAAALLGLVGAPIGCNNNANEPEIDLKAKANLKPGPKDMTEWFEKNKKAAPAGKKKAEPASKPKAEPAEEEKAAPAEEKKAE